MNLPLTLMNRRICGWVVLACLFGGGTNSPAAETVWLDSLDLSSMLQGKLTAQTNRNVAGNPMIIAGKNYDRGVGTHAFSHYRLDLGSGTERMLAEVGVDDASGTTGTVVFQILADGRTVFNSGLMKSGDPVRPVDVDLRSKKWLVLRVADGGDNIEADLANWANARFIVSGARPVPVAVVPEAPYLLTPKPGPVPRINGPKVYGCRPGNPFLFRIPTQGERPIKFSARGLPPSLKLDPTSGIIPGVAPERGEYRVRLTAKNRHATARREFKIISGDRLALTPTMGWNHWYAHYHRITDEKVRAAADLMQANGMADVGYDHVLIDDCWMNAETSPDPARVGPARDANGNMIPNHHFPDMRALTSYLHDKGFKAGIYSSPGPKTCGGYAGSYQHEVQDARQFAAWGFDLLKYDWCTYESVVSGDHSLGALQKPYRIMGEALQCQPRDIVFNLCQYGMGDVWKWAAASGGHSWRTGYDLGFELDRIYEIALRNVELRASQKPGAWNDPDYLQIGWVGDTRDLGVPKPCPLTPTEQYSFVSLWALLAAPLIYSGDLTRLDEFTLNVLCNPEVIEVNQDSRGECARVVRQSEEQALFIKNLEDGSIAVGLCNWGEFPAEMTARWEDLGVNGKHKIRDLWRQKDLGKFSRQFTTTVPRHGVTLLRLSKSR